MRPASTLRGSPSLAPVTAPRHACPRCHGRLVQLEEPTCLPCGWAGYSLPGLTCRICREPLTGDRQRYCSTACVTLHTHSTTGSRLNSLQWSLHILTPFTRRRPPLSQRWSGRCGLTTARCSIRWSWSPCRTAWPYFPLGSSRPRCRSRTPPPSIRVCGREVESGRVMACPGCGQVKLPKPPTEASAW